MILHVAITAAIAATAAISVHRFYKKELQSEKTKNKSIAEFADTAASRILSLEAENRRLGTELQTHINLLTSLREKALQESSAHPVKSAQPKNNNQKRAKKPGNKRTPSNT